jgi:hypothetical protein
MLVSFFIFGWLFLQLSAILRNPNAPQTRIQGALGWVITILISYALMILLHELVHGLFFWIITRQRPYIGLKSAYAYAAAPDWFIPRNSYLVIGLAPLVLITLLGVILIPWIPGDGLIVVIFILTANASGSMGDIFVVGWLSTQPRTTLLCDHGDKIIAYRPAPSTKPT